MRFYSLKIFFSIRDLAHSNWQWSLLDKLLYIYSLSCDVIPGGIGLPFCDELVKNPVQHVHPVVSDRDRNISSEWYLIYFLWICHRTFSLIIYYDPDESLPNYIIVMSAAVTIFITNIDTSHQIWHPPPRFQNNLKTNFLFNVNTF